jgi:diacylglycerol O-acyltransferase / wax synthase
MMIWPEKKGWSQDIAALALLDGRALLDADQRFRIATAPDVIARRLHLLPRFRQLLYRPPLGCGWPLWPTRHGRPDRARARACARRAR